MVTKVMEKIGGAQETVKLFWKFVENHLLRFVL